MFATKYYKRPDTNGAKIMNNEMANIISLYPYQEQVINLSENGANAGTIFIREGEYNCTNVCGTLKNKKIELLSPR